MRAVELIADALGRRQKEFGFAGLKDAQAVARQWITLQGADPAAVEALDIPGVRVLRVTRHGNKLKIGHLRGNRFRIRLRGSGAAQAESVQAQLAHLAAHGVPNFFGEQRFGKRGANLDKGLRILRGNPRKAARTMPRRLLNLIVSAVQSEAFNRVLNRRLETLDRVLPGDVAWLHRNGACFLVEHAESEQIRCDAFEISPSGPLPGPRLLQAQGEPGRIEREVLAELELDGQMFAKMPHGTHLGARRPLRVPLGEPAVEVEDGELAVAFALPAGAYATAVLRELLDDVPWFH
jgi:tRNA pseudouridine13 synthase